MVALGELRRPFPEKQYFGSPDLEATLMEDGKWAVIPAGSELPVPIFIEPCHFPGPGRPAPLISEDIHESTRSAYAQRGAFVKEGEGARLHREYLERNAKGYWGPYLSWVTMYNRSTQDIEVKGRIASHYVEGVRLTGENLVARIGRLDEPTHRNRPILFSGVPGEDWKFIYDNGHDDKSTVAGVYLKIDLTNRKWIPEEPKRKIILPSNYVGSRTHDIQKLLHPVPKTHNKILWIAKTTAQLHLPANVHGVLGKTVVSEVRKTELDELEKEGDKTQENSRHMKAKGKTNWEIYVEVFGSTLKAESPHYVPVFFFEE